MSHYREIVIETFENQGEPASERIRARPVTGQGLSTALRVECSEKMREGHPVGTKFKITAKLTRKEGGAEFLYSHYNWPYFVLTTEEASIYIKNNALGHYEHRQLTDCGKRQDEVTTHRKSRTVKHLASQLKISVTLLEAQLQQAGVCKTASSSLTPEDKAQLLDYLRRLH